VHAKFLIISFHLLAKAKLLKQIKEKLPIALLPNHQGTKRHDNSVAKDIEQLWQSTVTCQLAFITSHCGITPNDTASVLHTLKSRYH